MVAALVEGRETEVWEKRGSNQGQGPRMGWGVVNSDHTGIAAGVGNLVSLLKTH